MVKDENVMVSCFCVLQISLCFLDDLEVLLCFEKDLSTAIKHGNWTSPRP